MREHNRSFEFSMTVRILLCVLLGACVQLASAQQSPSGSGEPPTAGTRPNTGPDATDPNDLYRIGVGDVVELRVYNRPQLSVPAIRVDSRGIIRIPMVDEEVVARCRTEAELAQEITVRYRKYIRTPEVDIFIKEFQSRPAVVVGAVNTPGRFQLQRRIKLNELLSFAGGPSQRAGRTVQVVQDATVRQCEPPADSSAEETSPGVNMYALADTLRGDDKANPYVLPGEVVTVPEAEQVYVVGNVIAPTAIPMKDPITVSRAVAMAGGVSPIAKKNRVRIIRQDPGKSMKQEIFVDLTAIDSARAEDVVLQANDIVDVPSSDKKRILNGLVGAIAPAALAIPTRIIRVY